MAEKERKLRLMKQEKDIAALTNYLLWGTLAAVLLLFAGVVVFLKRIQKRDRLLMQARESLAQIKKEQLEQELTYRESQLSSMALQMVQKNEWIQELKEQIGAGNISTDESLTRVLEKELVRDREWSEFNTHFESINTTFYHRIKQAYPEISPNDLKLCALIKMNLSIKEMSAILNISPASVKTARYRLRKKLQLNNEDNLTEFILGLS